MGYPTKVQLIDRAASQQWYVNFPSALAQAMEFSKGETLEWIVADKSNLILTRHQAPPNPVEVKKKVPALTLQAGLQELMAVCSSASSTPRCAQRLSQHLLAALLCPERCTMTNLLCTSGLQQKDWSAHYRLYSQERVDEQVLFTEVCSHLQKALPPGAPLVAAMDDTLARKSGAHVHGTRWRRDPLGPAFQTNLIRAQRYLQFSAAWPLAGGQARSVPIGFYHVPGAGKPPKDADGPTLAAHREQCKLGAITTQAVLRMQQLRQQCEPGRQIVFCGDGSYTTKTVMRGLPANSLYIGRMRKDALLHELAAAKATGANGRPRRYGLVAPTPEALRQDEAVPWQQIKAFAAGKVHSFRIKTLSAVLWRKAGADLPVRIVVIAPLAYRLSKGAPLLYRRPAYLVCTDPNLPLEELLQYYLWRWGIEVNFREQKTLIGTGQAQVRTPASTQHLPAVTVAAYALLWVAALEARQSDPTHRLLQQPKWRARKRSDPSALPSTGELIRQLRFEAWAGALRPGTFSHFMQSSTQQTKSQKPAPSLPSALFCAA